MYFAKPDDGYAYSKVELGAIWELEETTVEAVKHRQRRSAYFSHIGDGRLAELLDHANHCDIFVQPDEAEELLGLETAEDRPATRE